MVDIGDKRGGGFVKKGNPIPICPNSSPGAGNCDGMIKHRNCPVPKEGGRAKFPGCAAYYIAAQKQKT